MHAWDAIEDARQSLWLNGKRHSGRGNIGYFDGHVGSWTGTNPETDGFGKWND